MYTVRNRLLVIVLLAATTGCLVSLKFINPYGGAAGLSEVLMQLSGSRGSFELGLNPMELLEFCMRLFPVFLCCAYTGIQMYRYYCRASIYIFSRISRRTGWFLKEFLILLGSAALFEAVFLASALLTAAIRFQVSVRTEGLVLCLWHLVIYTLWITAMSCLVTVLAVRLGSAAAYTVTAGLQFLFIAAMSPLNRISDDTVRTGRILAWNPMARLVAGWQSSRLPALNGELHSPYPGITLSGSLLYVGIICLACAAAAGFVVRFHDLIMTNSEESGGM